MLSLTCYSHFPGEREEGRLEKGGGRGSATSPKKKCGREGEFRKSVFVTAQLPKPCRVPKREQEGRSGRERNPLPASLPRRLPPGPRVQVPPRRPERAAGSTSVGEEALGIEKVVTVPGPPLTHGSPAQKRQLRRLHSHVAAPARDLPRSPLGDRSSGLLALLSLEPGLRCEPGCRHLS